MKRLLALFFLGWLCVSPASAQNVNLNCATGPAASPWLPASAANPCPVTSSGGSGGGGGGAGGTFAPTTPPSTATLTATAASSASTPLPTGSAVLFQNVGTAAVSCVLATGAATATADNIVIQAGGVSLILVGTNVNTACINQTGTASNKVDLIGGAVSTFGNNADANASVANGLIGQQAFNYLYNGTTWDRQRSGGNNADGVATVTLGLSEVQAFLMTWNGATWDRLQGVTLGPGADTASLPVLGPTPSSNALVGITPVVCGSAVNNCVLKAGAGNLYSVYADCTSACWLMVFNQTTAPGNGATTAGVAASNMTECVPIAAGGIGGVSYGSGPPAVYSTGITAMISSTACATLTTSTVGFIHGFVK